MLVFQFYGAKYRNWSQVYIHARPINFRQRSRNAQQWGNTMLENNIKISGSEPVADVETVLSVLDSERRQADVAAPAETTSRQFALGIQSLSARLVNKLCASGVEPSGAQAMAQEFTRKLATVFFALDIQASAPEAAWALSRQYNGADMGAFAMALHALLPDLILLCSGGPGRLSADQPQTTEDRLGRTGRRRLLVLAALVGCLIRNDRAETEAVQGNNSLAAALVGWAKGEMSAASAAPVAA